MNHPMAEPKRHPLYWLPNMISFGRLVLVIPYAWLFWWHLDSPYPFVLALIIILTDKLDGMFARRFKCESQLGETLDATGDQIFTTVAWVLFYINGMITFLMLAAIISIRILQGVSLIIHKVRRKHWNTRHLIWGKLGVIQFVAIPWLLLRLPYAAEIIWISIVLTLIGTLFSELERHKLI